MQSLFDSTVSLQPNGLWVCILADGVSLSEPQESVCFLIFICKKLFKRKCFHCRYRNFQYRKQTKNQFARDDPAFLVLLSVWLLVSATGLSLVLHLHMLGFFKFLLWIVFIDCILVGIIVASLFWFITNRYMKRSASANEDVEWGFAFDIHLNAFFPPLLILHVFQLFFYNGTHTLCKYLLIYLKYLYPYFYF